MSPRHFHTQVGSGPWRHRKSGRWYTVVCTALMEADQTPVTVYQDEQNGAVWVRPLAEFLERFDPEGSGSIEEDEAQ